MSDCRFEGFSRVDIIYVVLGLFLSVSCSGWLLGCSRVLCGVGYEGIIVSFWAFVLCFSEGV